MLRTFIIILLLQTTAFVAWSAQYENVTDLEKHWYFNDDEQSFPYVKGNGLSAEAIHFQVNLQRYSGQYLRVNHVYGGAIFIDGKLARYVDEDFSLAWNVDSLINQLGNREVLFTFYSERKGYDNLQTVIARKLQNISANDNLMEIQERSKLVSDEMLILIIVLLIFLAIVLNTNTPLFRIFYSFDNVIFGRIRDDSVYQLKLFSQANMLFFAFHASVVSFLVLCVERYTTLAIPLEPFLFNSIIINWVFLSIIILVAFLMKYLLIRYVGVLFDMGVAANYYFFEYMRMSMIFFITVFSLSAVLVISLPHLSLSIANIGLKITLIFMVLRFIVLFFRVGKHAPFKNIHLFSYLCTTEILPIIIGIKYIF